MDKFKTVITKIKHPNFDYNVTVIRLSDGAEKSELISGGQNIIDQYVKRMKHDLDEDALREKRLLKNPSRNSLRSLKLAEAEHYAQPAVNIDIDVDSHNAKRGSKTRVNPRLKLGKKMHSVDFAPVPSRITYGPNHYATIRKNNLGEYVVRFWTYGKHIKDADYFAADQKDAIDTANAELTRMTQIKSNPLKGEKHIALQEKRGTSWFTIAYFPHNQKAIAIKLGKQLHRRYPNKTLRLFA